LVCGDALHVTKWSSRPFTRSEKSGGGQHDQRRALEIGIENAGPFASYCFVLGVFNRAFSSIRVCAFPSVPGLIHASCSHGIGEFNLAVGWAFQRISIKESAF
jgi:hypothetical protein